MSLAKRVSIYRPAACGLHLGISLADFGSQVGDEMQDRVRTASCELARADHWNICARHAQPVLGRRGIDDGRQELAVNMSGAQQSDGTPRGTVAENGAPGFAFRDQPFARTSCARPSVTLQAAQAGGIRTHPDPGFLFKLRTRRFLRTSHVIGVPLRRPVGFRCAGCDHFRADAAPAEEEITRIRRLTTQIKATSPSSPPPSAARWTRPSR
jgi:hypothetical protein